MSGFVQRTPESDSSPHDPAGILICLVFVDCGDQPLSSLCHVH